MIKPSRRATDAPQVTTAPGTLPDITTPAFVTTDPSVTTDSLPDAALEIHVRYVDRNEARLVILSGDGVTSSSFEVSLFSSLHDRPIVQRVARTGRLTSLTLRPLAAGSTFSAVVRAESSNGQVKQANVTFETTPGQCSIA